MPRVAIRTRFRHIESLDGVRGIAILVVFFHHLAFTSLSAGDWSPAVRGFAQLFSQGALGVDLFFVLSGYLITTLLLIDRRDPNGYWNFYVKRFFRIVPALLASLAFGYATGFLSGATVVLSLIFLANYSRLVGLPTVGGYWSLSVEEQFYLVWPLAIRRLRFERFLWLIAGVILVEPFVRFAMNFKGHGTLFFTFVRCDGLAWGAMLGASAYYGRIYSRPQNARAWWLRFGRWFAIAGTGLMAIMVAFLSVRNLGPQRNTVVFTIVPLAFAGLIAHLICHPALPVSRLFRLRPLTFFGDISYGLYLIHLNVSFVYDRYWPLQPGDDAGYWIRIAVVLAVSTLLCTLSLHFFERPMLRRRNGYLRPAGLKDRTASTLRRQEHPEAKVG